MVTVLVLASCHSFPGPSSLSSLIERTGCTVDFYSPDCSPSRTTLASHFASISSDTSPLTSTSKSTSTRTRTYATTSIFSLEESWTSNHDSVMKTDFQDTDQCEMKSQSSTESQTFELSPIDFISEKGCFWSKWGGKVDIILTFNSYLESLQPTLNDRGFTEVT